MAEPTIICPHCNTTIKLTESLAAPLLEATKRDFQQRLQQKDSEVKERENALRQREESLQKQKESIDSQVAEKVRQEKSVIAADEARKARLALASEMDEKAKQVTEMETRLKQQDQKLAEAQKAQADLLRKQRELDDAKRELDLTVEKRVQESVTAIRQQARTDAEGESKLKVKEKEEIIAGMQKQIEELKRRSEQGSQQLQGEAQEVELEAVLRGAFPGDRIEPVPKGEHGGDILQHVVGPRGQHCGVILWESKRTKNWSDGWLAKLRDDQRAARAEIAILVSQALPKGVESFDIVEGVWVAHPRFATPLAAAMRLSLIEVAAARLATEGQQTKMEMVYQYLTGPGFRQRVQAIMERFNDMQQDLEKERKTMTLLWAKREKQIRGVLEATCGMYGDLQGIAGSNSFREIEGMVLKILSDGTGINAGETQ